jgi:hypothetical protein
LKPEDIIKNTTENSLVSNIPGYYTKQPIADSITEAIVPSPRFTQDPAISSRNEGVITITAKLNTDGKMYAILLNPDEEAPDSEQIRSGFNAFNE